MFLSTISALALSDILIPHPLLSDILFDVINGLDQSPDVSIPLR